MDIFNTISQNVIGSILAGIFLAGFFFAIRDRIKSRNNLSGRWLLYEKIMNSDLSEYMGTSVRSTMNISHTEASVHGFGERYSEVTISNGEIRYASNKTAKHIIQGNFDWRFLGRNILRLVFSTTNPDNRKFSTYVTLRQMSRDRLEGSFVSEFENSIGTAVLTRQSITEFETGFFYLCTRFLSKFLRVELVENPEHQYVKYFARSKQIQGRYADLREILIRLEDRKFKSHKGLVVTSFCRGLMSQSKIVRRHVKLLKSGGSTITIQLARTLFIKNFARSFRRKVLEISIAYQLENLLTKDQIIDMYLSAVRFSLGIYGIKKGTKHFFGEEKETLTLEESFFMVERLSALRNNYSPRRIKHLVESLVGSNIHLNYDEVIKLYTDRDFPSRD